MNSKAINISNNLNNPNNSNNSNNLDNFLDKINSKQKSKSKSKIIFEKYSNIELENNIEPDFDLETESDLESEEISQLESESEEISQLESELEKNFNQDLPKNYGSKWKPEEISMISGILTKGKISDLDGSDKQIIKLSKKLNRSVGGVLMQIKKIIFDKYISGMEPESIASELSISFLIIKSIIKNYLLKDTDSTINLLEKENKLLTLKIENIKLKKELEKLTK